MKILWVSAGPDMNKTGYGLQTATITKYLHDKGYDIAIRSSSLKGGEGEWEGIKLLPNIPSYTHIDETMYGQCKRLGIDLVLPLFDVWIFMPEMVRNLVSNGIMFVPYVPIDCEIVPPGVAQTLRESSLIIAMSKYGEKLIKNIRGLPQVTHIPHSIDTNVFRPYPRTKNKDKFVVTQIKTNSGERPDWPTLMEAFKWFVHDTGLTPAECELHLHTHGSPPGKAEGPTGYNIRLLAELLGIREYVTLPPDWGHTLAIDNETMARELYSQTDVFMNSTIEGFGLPTLEAESCGVPALVVDEIGGQVELVPPEARMPVGWKYMTPNYARRAHLDPEKAKDMLVKLYNDESYRKELGQKARKLALDYDNSKVLPLWPQLLDKIEDSRKNREILKWGNVVSKVAP